MSKTIKDFFIMASGEILSEWLPEDWSVWKDEELNKWLEQHACEPYEGWSGEELWEQIDSVAHLLMGIYNDATAKNERLRRSVDNIKIRSYELGQRELHDMSLAALKENNDES